MQVLRRDWLPRQWSVLVRAGWFSLVVPLWHVMDDLREWDGCFCGCPAGRANYAILLLLPLATAVLAAPNAYAWLRRRLARRRITRRCAPTTTLAALPDGAHARLHGRIVAGDPFVSASGRSRVVLASYLMTSSRATLPTQTVEPMRVLAGGDFTLALATGEEIRVRVADMDGLNILDAQRALTAVGRPAPAGLASDACDLVHDELTLALGDEVEIFGRLQRVVDPHAEAGGRGDRLAFVIDAAVAAPYFSPPGANTLGSFSPRTQPSTGSTIQPGR